MKTVEDVEFVDIPARVRAAKGKWRTIAETLISNPERAAVVNVAYRSNAAAMLTKYLGPDWRVHTSVQGGKCFAWITKKA